MRDAPAGGAETAAAQHYDRAASNALLLETLPHILAVCRARLRQPTDVGEALREMRLSLRALRHTYDAVRPFRPRLNSMADRCAID